MSLYIEPREYTMDDYRNDIYNQYIESEKRLLQVFQGNDNFELADDHPIFKSLTSLVESNLSKVNKSIIHRDFSKSFSELSIDEYIIEVSLFICQIGSKSHRKRFENIFINTSDSINLSPEERSHLDKEDFRYRNLRDTDISKLLLLFSNDTRLTSTLLGKYIHHFQLVIARLKNNVDLYSHIPKQWKLDESNRSQYKQYASKNAYYLYQDLFKLQVSYPGYLGYLGKNMYIFQALFKYIDPYVNDLNRLHVSQDSIIDESHMLMVNRFLFMFILHKLVEFHNKVKQNDQEIISLLEECVDVDEEINIPTIEHFTEYFIMDYITDIFQMHYDSKWVVSNINLDDLTKRLSKQKEKEKQSLIHKLDTMSDEKRLLTMEKQKNGIINFFKTSGEENVSRVIDEYTNINDDERYSMFNNLMSSDNIVDEVNGVYTGELPNAPDLPNQLLPNIEEEEEEKGYTHDVDDMGEDGQMEDDY